MADKTAKEDLLLERTDLGPECYTLIVKGERIPSELAQVPAHPRDPEKPPRRKG